MLQKNKSILNDFLRPGLCLLLTIFLVRIYEYVTVASRFFIGHAYRFELLGILYDLWLWLLYSLLLFIPFFILHRLQRSVAMVAIHTLHVVLLILYLALLLTFSERNTPFDHEFFTRNANESWLTVKQMMTSGVKVYFPFVLYVSLYFFLYHLFFKNWLIGRSLQLFICLLALFSLVFIRYATPSPNWFAQPAGYYLTSNKLSYWAVDSYRYLQSAKQENRHLNNKELENEILFYQQQQPFQFTSTEYPLLHVNEDKDVLGPYFNLGKEPPNIVILVVEGLSRDFSGNRAYAGSFTPFLDSLSKQSLVWDNFLSTAPGTFAAHPAISGSLPYGRNGFSIMNVMPDHLSLIKILKANGYFTQFLVGFDPDFDNMGGYIRAQGTDFILNHYESRYKKMGAGTEGWSMGYPDDALFSRSFEVLDSIHQFPYLSIYHTATTHMPYLFRQKPVYEKLFDQKIRAMHVTPVIRRTLKETKNVLTTFMFSDDCLKQFFAAYAQRPEFDNTIFFITGDHHIGSFPSTCTIDDYHVPFLIYSPLLKKAQRFLSVNSHNNIAPTITNLVLHNYHLPYYPKEVHWLGDVLDTGIAFRNRQSMPFMAWSREIKDYLYDGYFLSGNQLYKLTPDLLQEEYHNDTLQQKMVRLRENFKLINRYVCEQNKILPLRQKVLPGPKILLHELSDTLSKLIFSRSDDTTLAADFKVPPGYQYLYVEAEMQVKMEKANPHPTIRFAIIDNKNNDRNYLFWSKRDVITLGRAAFLPKQWNALTINDLFTLNDYKGIRDLYFETALYTDKTPIDMQLRQLKVRIYGIK